MKKDTLTITFHAALNNGSFLQSYALQQVLIQKCRVNNKIIDLQIPAQKRLYSIFRSIQCKQDILKNIVSMLHYKKLKRRKMRFEEMRRQYLFLTNEVQDTDSACALTNSADIIICGSDQIWNTKARDFDKAYFLPTVNKYKISYAVSQGSKAKEEDLNEYSRYIQNFDALSVREESMKYFLENISGKQVETVLDPTLLLSSEDYKVLFNKSPIIEQDYILLYSMNYTEEIIKTVKRISKEFNMPIVTPFTTYSTEKAKKVGGIRIIYDCAPDCFLNLIYNAKLVVTDSFHGTAFSLIFHKDFYHVCEADSNGIFKKDDRIDNLLDALQLRRNICATTNILEIRNNYKINYQYIEISLQELRKKSLLFLQNALEGEKYKE